MLMQSMKQHLASIAGATKISQHLVLLCQNPEAGGMLWVKSLLPTRQVSHKQVQVQQPGREGLMKVKDVGDTIRLSPSAEEVSRQVILNYLHENNTYVFVNAAAWMAWREGPQHLRVLRMLAEITVMPLYVIFEKPRGLGDIPKEQILQKVITKQMK